MSNSNLVRQLNQNSKIGFSGFSMIELLVVLSIIGALAAIAIPNYSRYTVRSNIAEGLNLAEPFKTDIAKYYTENQALPPSGWARAPSGVTSSKVTSVTYDLSTPATPRLKIIFAPTAIGTSATTTRNLYLVPTANSTTGNLTWECTNNPDGAGTVPVASVPDDLLPKYCKSTD